MINVKPLYSMSLLSVGLLLGNVLAQNSSIGVHFNSELKKLPTYGNKDVGTFPFCSDIKKVYEREMSALAMDDDQALELIDSLNTNSTELEYEIIAKSNVEQQAKRNEPLGEEGLKTEKHELSNFIPSSGGGCFTGNTPVTALLVENTFAKKVPMEVYNGCLYHLTITNTYFNMPYILSSTVSLYPEDRKYIKDCWSKIKHYHTAKIPHGEKILTIGLTKPNSKNAETLEVTAGHRFYVYSKTTNEYLWVRAKDLDVDTMLLSQSSMGAFVKIDFVSDYSVEDENLFGTPKSKTVYNLSTDTFTYYVGSFDHKVLVHNLK